MALQVNKARLAALNKNLWRDWGDTQSQWRDGKAAEFQKKHLEEMLASSDAALEMIEDLDKLLKKIRRDCE